MSQCITMSRGVSHGVLQCFMMTHDTFLIGYGLSVFHSQFHSLAQAPHSSTGVYEYYIHGLERFTTVDITTVSRKSHYQLVFRLTISGAIGFRSEQCHQHSRVCQSVYR